MIYPVFWIILAFIAWIFTFWGFLNLKLIIFSDAISYFEHIQYFIQSLSKGVFPLWNPSWCEGVSNEFFLRRFGAYNPFYSVMAAFKALGLSYALSYLWFFAFYYWSGAIAFYLLGMRLYQNRLIAYAGYLLILFSALGTRIFDSYMMLVTVPILWFFYYLVAFTQTPSKRFFLGICLSFMILVTTYIPFYFLSFLALFIFLFVVFYFQEIPQIISKYWNFFKLNKLLVSASVLIVLLSFLPLLMFFHNSSQGNVVMPVRHGTSETTAVLTVPLQTVDWGAVEDLMFSVFHSDLSTYTFAIVYVPFFVVIVFLLGFFLRVSKRAMFLFLCGFTLFCCIVPHGLPFYDFLYKHVFFLKYFRNLHFFLWFVLIPLFILLVLEHWRMFEEARVPSSKNRLSILVTAVHLLAFLFVYSRADAIISTYLMIALSFTFWISLIRGVFDQRYFLGFGLLTAAILVQPIEVYHYLTQRADKNKGNYYASYEARRGIFKSYDPQKVSAFDENKKPQLYYASRYYNDVYENVDNLALQTYLQYKILLVDHVQLMEPSQLNYKDLQDIFLKNPNKAIVFEPLLGGFKNAEPNPKDQAQRILGEDKDFKILSFNANQFKIRINTPYDKFLVYNDSFDPAWQVKIDGRRVSLYQTNEAFKGVYVPAGEHIIEFRYGSTLQYILNYVLLIGAFILLIGILCFGRNI